MYGGKWVAIWKEVGMGFGRWNGGEGELLGLCKIYDSIMPCRSSQSFQIRSGISSSDLPHI